MTQIDIRNMAVNPLFGPRAWQMPLPEKRARDKALQQKRWIVEDQDLMGSVIDHNLSISHYPANMLDHCVDVGERIAIDGNQIS